MLKTHHQTPGSRKALQPKNNSPASITPTNIKLILQPSTHNNNNKENIPPNSVIIEDASLADELSSIRLKLDRLRLDKEKTQKMLNERVLMLDLKMKDIIHRGDVQKQLEIEVDRLYRLNQIRLSCLRISPIRTLRDKEHEKKTKQNQLKANINIQDCDQHKQQTPELEEEEEDN